MTQTVAIDVKLKGTDNSHELQNQGTLTLAMDLKTTKGHMQWP